MAISSAGGTILNNAILVYPDMAAYHPVINGVAGERRVNCNAKLNEVFIGVHFFF
jgi:hypothetical protein